MNISEKMSCLLPQFKCLPDTFAVNFKSYNHSSIHPSKNRDLTNFKTQCILSATSSRTLTITKVLEKLQLPSLEANSTSLPADRSWKAPTSRETTAVLDLEKLKLPSLDTDPIPIAANKPRTYNEGVGPPSEVNLGATLATESLLTSEEAVIAAAASEALALARAAVKVAKDAAKMASHLKTIKFDGNTTGILSENDNKMFEKSWLPEIAERIGVSESRNAEIGSDQNLLSLYSLTESDDVEPRAEELEFLEAQLSNIITVRSKRQEERKARRTRAAEKAAANILSMKSGSTSRKKSSSIPDLDYSDPLRYLRRTTSTRLLTAPEEKELSAGIQDLLKLEILEKELTERYEGKPTFSQWAAAAGVDQKTLRERISYGILCKDKMINSNVRLVISIAKNYQGAGMNLQDLVQEGCRGLVRGAEKFDASKGFKFSTYAHWWIKQAVRKSLSDQSRTIRLPFHMVEETYRVKEARKQLYSENGIAPNNEEVAEAAGLSMKRLSAVLLTPKAPRSLDQKIGINQNLKPSDVIADPEAETAEDLLIKQFMKEDLAKVLDILNPREKQVIRWRFGLDDGRMKTLQEIGELMGVSRERIRQIESCAFRKLKNKKRTNHLQQYVMP